MRAVTLERTLTELDHVRLLNLLRRDVHADESSAQRKTITDLLNASGLVLSREVPPDVVTMNSQALLQDLQSGEHIRLTLCYPADADAATGYVSVLSPVGSALLGLSAGCIARWHTPTGDLRAARVLLILFQPEASGDYSM